MVTIEASILSADYARLGEQAREAEAAGVDGIQIDVMDGRFVPNITFGPGIVRALRPLVTVTLDVDLMIVEPERHLVACTAKRSRIPTVCCNPSASSASRRAWRSALGHR